MSHTITSQFISDNISRLITMTLQDPLEKPLSSSAITLRLKIHINNLTIPKALAALMGQALLVNCSPQILLLTIYFDEDFIEK
jgi:hypothetical protein